MVDDSAVSSPPLSPRSGSGLLFAEGTDLDTPWLRNEVGWRLSRPLCSLTRMQLATRTEGLAELRERTHKLRVAAKRFRDTLTEAASAHRTFSAALEGFGSGEDDEVRLERHAEREPALTTRRRS